MIRRTLTVAVLPIIATGMVAAPSTAQTRPAPRSPFPAFVDDRGHFTSFESADPTVALGPFGINDSGVIVGEYERPDSESGFVRDRHGKISSFDVPGAAGTEASDINDSGVIAGTYSDDTPIVNNSAHPHGYLRHGHTFTRIDVPGAAITSVSAVNNRGQAIGNYQDAAGVHGFLWDRGRITTIDVPGGADTTIVGINDRDEIVGSTTDAAMQTYHGFVWRKGRATGISVPGVNVTIPQDINDRGQITGYIGDDVNLTGAHGFLLSRPGGPVRRIDVPGAPRTLATDLDDRGRITGLYENPATGPDRTEMPRPAGGITARR